MRVIHFLVPPGIDDPKRPSGGNVYDRRTRDGLRARGWVVHEHAIRGRWPQPDAAARATVADVLATLADSTVVLIDGLIASTVPNALRVQANRLRLVILLHMPLGNEPPTDGICSVRSRERTALTAVSAVIVTSVWTKNWLCAQYSLSPGRVRVATPGADAVEQVMGTASGSELLCVAAVTPLKGHDVLLSALRIISDLPWHCTFVGSLDLDPPFVERLQRTAAAAGLDDRIRFTGPVPNSRLADAYVHADLLVLASRRESFGMVVGEALAHGLPVIASNVGGISQALGMDADGEVPGLLVPPDAPMALGAALRAWLQDIHLRARLRRVAGQRRATLSGWSITVEKISQVLTEAAA